MLSAPPKTGWRDWSDLPEIEARLAAERDAYMDAYRAGWNPAEAASLRITTP